MSILIRYGERLFGFGVLPSLKLTDSAYGEQGWIFDGGCVIGLRWRQLVSVAFSG
jgi:hypothetical protein